MSAQYTPREGRIIVILILLSIASFLTGWAANALIT